MERLLSGGGEGGGTGEASPGLAFGWGLLSASSLVLGAAIGIARLPSKVVRAAMMAFGGGALIEALSIELFAHIINTARGGHGHGDHGEGGSIDRGLVFLALGAALGGGLLFAGLDTAISGHGAFLRKASTVHAYVSRLRSALFRRLVARLKRVPMFEVLDESELERLARSAIKERYAPGSTIFQELSRDSSIYFVLSGRVDLTLTTQYWAGETTASWREESAMSIGARSAHGDLVRQTSGSHHPVDEVKDCFKLGPNDIFGEMALFTGDTVQAKAVASSRTTVLRIPRAAIHKLLASNRRLQDFVAMTAIDRLRETEVFCHCTPSTVARLVSFMRQAEFEAGDVLYHDVDAFCPIYLVVLGCAEVVRGSGEGASRHLVHANGLLGTEHLVLGTAVHAVATAVERTTVLIIQRSDIDKLCEKDERFRQALLASAQGYPWNADTKSERKWTTDADSKNDRKWSADPKLPNLPSKGVVSLDDLHIQVDPTSRFPTACTGCFQGYASRFLGVRTFSQRVNPQERRPTPPTTQTAVALAPPEGQVGPSRFGCNAEEFGWHRQSPDDEPDKEKDAADTRDARTFSEPFSADEIAERERALQEDEEGGLLGGDTDLPELLENEDAAAAAEGKEGHGHESRGAQAAVMIWLGILIDGVPESFVMGILVNTASQGTLLAFVVGVFLANFPEAMSSAGTMRLCGMRKRVIMLMWSSIMILTGIGAGLGAIIFPPGSTDDPTVVKVIAGIEGLCGGAMLCMIANTVLPEAFEQGGNVTGLSTLLGFIVAVSVSVAS